MLRFLLDEHKSPPVLVAWPAKELRHQRVVFVDERTYQPQASAGIADVVVRISDDLGSIEWTDRVAFAKAHLPPKHPKIQIFSPFSKVITSNLNKFST